MGPVGCSVPHSVEGRREQARCHRVVGIPFQALASRVGQVGACAQPDSEDEVEVAGIESKHAKGDPVERVCALGDLPVQAGWPPSDAVHAPTPATNLIRARWWARRFASNGSGFRAGHVAAVMVPIDTCPATIQPLVTSLAGRRAPVAIVPRRRRPHQARGDASPKSVPSPHRSESP